MLSRPALSLLRRPHTTPGPGLLLGPQAAKCDTGWCHTGHCAAGVTCQTAARSGLVLSESNGLRNGKSRLRDRPCPMARGVRAASRDSSRRTSPRARGASPGEELAGADAARCRRAGRGTRERTDGIPGPGSSLGHGEGDCPTNLAEPALPGGRAAPRRSAGRPARRPAPAAPRAAAGTPAGSASGSTRSAWPRPLREDAASALHVLRP